MLPGNDNSIKCSLGSRGASQLELKVTYPFRNRRKSRFQAELYFQIPRQISISMDERGRRDLLDDTRSQTRFNVANMPLSWLTDTTGSDSPIGRIYREMDKLQETGRINESRVIYELRTFGNLFTVQLKSLVKLLQNALRNSPDRADGLAAGRETVRDAKNALKQFRELGKLFLDPSISENVRSAHALVDEYTGDQAVRYLLGLTTLISREPSLQKFSEQLEKFLLKELAYQTERGYSAIRADNISPEDLKALEKLITRESRLKKWVQKVLYLDVAESGVPRRIGHILAGIAAATAMSVAVIAAFYANRMFASYSLPWALLIVGSYIVKDRIKETLRAALVHFFPMAVTDRTRLLHDPATDKSVGRARLSIREVDIKDVPARSIRLEDTLTLQETVDYHALEFVTAVRLNGSLLLKNHRRVNGIVDIMRIRIDQWLRDLDAPAKSMRLFRENQTVAVTGPRTYQILVSVHLKTDRDRSSIVKHWTVTLDRNGIRRVEPR